MCVDRPRWDFLLTRRAFWHEIRAEGDVTLAGDVNRGSPHSSLSNSPRLCSHFIVEHVSLAHS